ncbi:MAG: mismatch repair protein MutS [Halanaerobiales bacterium]|nr:mismatch repair protein MutS [Halanaerobiales bacterium]
MSKLTPMMQQYESIKRKYPDAILFFRLGDFYEMFNDDAKIAARVLDLALTSRNRGGGEKAPMAGVPFHSADSYIAKLIAEGYKVAICEQLEDPEEAKGIVERDVIRVITPGTVIENEMLKEKDNNFLAAAINYKEKLGFAYVDISTGEFLVTELEAELEDKLWDEIDRIHPREILTDESLVTREGFNNLIKRIDFVHNEIEPGKVEKAYDYLREHFQTRSLAGYGCEEMDAAILAAGEILKFLKETQKRALAHINKLTTYNLNDYMVLDSATRRNLELTSTIRGRTKKGSLLNILDRTVTSMGGRLIKKWINQPLINKDEIEMRLEAVAELVNNYIFLQRLRNNLDGIYDLERILSKVTYGTANARDLSALKFSLLKLPDLKQDISSLKAGLFSQLNSRFDPLEDLADLLNQALVDEPPVSVREGGLIRDGYNQELDELRRASREGKEWITNLQKTERERTGINSLKVGFNKVFGYYLEVTKANLDKVPENYTRKQTLSNSERYITPELKEKEALVLGAEEKINQLEYDLFVELRDKVGENIERIKETAVVIAFLDVLASLSLVTLENDFQRPEIHNDGIIEIKEGRHPVVEEMVEGVFVPNDTYLDTEENRFIIITGPNMSGKSTYMRQVALIVLMAQMGSFVPARKARIGIVDRIFTRVGASDDLTTGQSTFMVEMNEVANIVNNATGRSLIILDEVGRGTSTYDGLSIAWAVSEYINNPEKIGARALFATHYHELTRLEEKLPGIKNYNVLVEEDENGVHFLHKIVPGRASDSYGIEVARLAGLPEEIINNARKILDRLEHNEGQIAAAAEESITEVIAEKEVKELVKKEVKEPKEKQRQLALFKNEDPIVRKLKEKDLLNLTPMEAMNFLYQLQQEARKEGEDNG